MMTSGTERDDVDVRGFVLAVTGSLAAGVTFLITPGSGAGPATMAVLSWLAALTSASWAALVDDGASTWGRFGAVVVAAATGTAFLAAIESGWALAIPGLVIVAALGRRRSRSRFVALAAWLLIAGYILFRAASR